MYSRQRFGPVWVSFRVWTDPYSSQPAALHPLFLPNFSVGSCFVKEKNYVTKVFTTVEFPDIPRFSKPHFLRETVESRSLRGVVGCCCSKWKSRVSLLFLGGGREKGVWCGKEDATRIYCAFLPFTFTYTHTPEKKGENTLFSRHCNNGTAWLIVKRS